GVQGIAERTARSSPGGAAGGGPRSAVAGTVLAAAGRAAVAERVIAKRAADGPRIGRAREPSRWGAQRGGPRNPADAARRAAALRGDRLLARHPAGRGSQTLRPSADPLATSADRTRLAGVTAREQRISGRRAGPGLVGCPGR